jgi:hypothetical protein
MHAAETSSRRSPVLPIGIFSCIVHCFEVNLARDEQIVFLTWLCLQYGPPEIGDRYRQSVSMSLLLQSRKDSLVTALAWSYADRLAQAIDPVIAFTHTRYSASLHHDITRTIVSPSFYWAADEHKGYCTYMLPGVYMPPLHFFSCYDSERCPEAALFCILKPLLGRAAELSAPGIKKFEEQGKLTELCRHIRAWLARLPSSAAGSPCDIFFFIILTGCGHWLRASNNGSMTSKCTTSFGSGLKFAFPHCNRLSSTELSTNTSKGARWILRPLHNTFESAYSHSQDSRWDRSAPTAKPALMRPFCHWTPPPVPAT